MRGVYLFLLCVCFPFAGLAFSYAFPGDCSTKQEEELIRYPHRLGRLYYYAEEFLEETTE